jgi:hypothetical protein
MSNLHKDLTNDQIHNPKDFGTAANSTKLTKNASGNLEWVADSGGGSGVSQIVAGTNVTIAPTGGTGVVTINSSGGGGTDTNLISRNVKAYGNILFGSEFGLGNAQYNNEHKFSTNLGSPAITTISPKNMVNSSIWVCPKSGSGLRSWNGWCFGASGQKVVLSLLRVIMPCPVPSEEYPSTIDVCRAASVSLTMTGNNTPLCFDIESFTTCEGWSETLTKNEVLLLSAYCPEGKDSSFMLNCQILLEH